MFGNRSFNVKLVKDQPSMILPDSGPIFERHDIKQIQEAVNDFVTRTAATGIIVMTGYKVLDTVCKIAVLAAKSKFK